MMTLLRKLLLTLCAVVLVTACCKHNFSGMLPFITRVTTGNAPGQFERVIFVYKPSMLAGGYVNAIKNDSGKLCSGTILDSINIEDCTKNHFLLAVPTDTNCALQYATKYTPGDPFVCETTIEQGYAQAIMFVFDANKGKDVLLETWLKYTPFRNRVGVEFTAHHSFAESTIEALISQSRRFASATNDTASVSYRCLAGEHEISVKYTVQGQASNRVVRFASGDSSGIHIVHL
jgi:hypothetical protein